MEIGLTTDQLYEMISRAADFGIFNNCRENLDVTKLAAILASIDSAQYYTDNMLYARRFTTREDALMFAIGSMNFQGLVLEFGVATGRTVKILGENVSSTVYGFDSFEGLPQDWRDRFRRGNYSMDPPKDLPRNVELVIGLFEEVLPQFVAAHQEDISLLHVDCDLYSSTKTVFAHLGDRIVPGTIIHFDEYFNYPGWRVHEYKAFREFVDANGIKYKYVGLNSAHQQVTVEIIDRARL